MKSRYLQGRAPSEEKAMAHHSSTLAWKIPWMEEPGGLQSMGSLRVGHDWVTSLSLFPFMHRRRKWQPTPVFLPGESQRWGSLWAAVYGVAQSRSQLKRLSSSSSSRADGVGGTDGMGGGLHALQGIWTSYSLSNQRDTVFRSAKWKIKSGNLVKDRLNSRNTENRECSKTEK